MKPGIWRKLDGWARQLSPFAMTFALLLVSTVPLRVPAMERVAPILPLIATYYWTLHRPELMPAAAAFAFGFLIDALSGAPLGVNALVFVLVHLVVNTQRRVFVGKSFTVLWLVSSLVLAAALLLAWLLTCALWGRFYGFGNVLFQAVIAIGAFPGAWWVLNRCHLMLFRPETSS
jgi:rod shape-determining protein MreD